MKHFVLPVPPGPGGIVRLYEKDYHYLVRVRRLKAGMFFDALLPGGAGTRVKILSTIDNILIGECEDWESGELKVPESRHSPQIPPIVLFQGLPRGSKMDTIIRQAAEGEVSIVAPLVSEYSGPGAGSPQKMKRWEKIIKEARQQSGSTLETRLMPPSSLEGLLDFWDNLKKDYQKPLGILLHQEPLEKGSFHGYLGNCPDLTALLVGPEGGFSPGEVSLFLAAGFKPLLMGNSILRCETAALYGIAAIRILLLESEAWSSIQTE